jgi:hypothetical protein
MRTNTVFGCAALADHRKLRPLDMQGEAFRLTRRAALSVILMLSLGLWAALWMALASLASAVFG